MTGQVDERKPRWVCEACRLPILANDGILFCRVREAMAGGAPWHVGHDRCVNDAEITADAYVIASGRIDSWEKVASWCVHLMRKPWVRNTNWPGLIHAAGAIDA